MRKVRDFQVTVRMEPTDKPTPEQIAANEAFWKVIKEKCSQAKNKPDQAVGFDR
jgi:hypothetical protein